MHNGTKFSQEQIGRSMNTLHFLYLGKNATAAVVQQIATEAVNL